jgi:hypothetical protein
MRFDSMSVMACLFVSAATVASAQQPYLVADRDPATNLDSGIQGTWGDTLFVLHRNASGFDLWKNNGPYGSLTGKAVALEPATGFSFDTPLTPRAR